MSQWTVEQFAELCAYLEAYSSTRAEVLAQVGLDEASWASHRAEWLKLLADRDTPELAWVFGRAYVRALGVCLAPAPAVPADLASPEVDASAEKAPPDASVDDETVILAPEPSQEDDPDRTSLGAFPLSGPALPFKSTGFPAVSATFQATPRPALPSSAGAEPADPTVVLDYFAPPQRVIPFDRPRKPDAKK